MNASNRTFNNNYFDKWNVNSWGLRFRCLGVVVNINMREFFSLQPGFFFQSRSGNYSLVEEYINNRDEKDNFIQIGDYRIYNFVIPVMASFRFSIADNLKWLVEAGPYAQFKLHATDADKIEVISQDLGGSINKESAKAISPISV